MPLGGKCGVGSAWRKRRRSRNDDRQARAKVGAVRTFGLVVESLDAMTCFPSKASPLRRWPATVNFDGYYYCFPLLDSFRKVFLLSFFLGLVLLVLVEIE